MNLIILLHIIIDLRESEIKENFNLFINNINNSFNSAISIKRQKYVLLVSEDDFFNIGNIVSDNIIETSKSLKDKYLYLYDFGTEGDKYSVVSRYYLENSINGKQIEQFYSSVNDNTFVDLSLYKFENLLVNNWIFDRREFILKLNESLLTSNREIENNLISKNDTYSEDLEEEIIRVLKNESNTEVIFVSTLHEENLSSKYVSEFFGLKEYLFVNRRNGRDRQVHICGVKREDIPEYISRMEKKIAVLYGYNPNKIKISDEERTEIIQEQIQYEADELSRLDAIKDIGKKKKFSGIIKGKKSKVESLHKLLKEIENSREVL